MNNMGENMSREMKLARNFWWNAAVWVAILAFGLYFGFFAGESINVACVALAFFSTFAATMFATLATVVTYMAKDASLRRKNA